MESVQLLPAVSFETGEILAKKKPILIKDSPWD